MNSLFDDWLYWKRQEEKAQTERRSIEDQIKKQYDVPDNLDGTLNISMTGYSCKVIGRIDRKVDSDKLQQLAAEAGLTDHLSSLFKWKPEVNLTLWKAADPSITRPLADAITASPGRPSFKILPKE
jgi:hypothetical protein